MENLKNVIDSFKIQKQLYPKIWSEPGDKMNPKVRNNLLEIANEFISSFGIDVIISDIIVVGSIANYNWSKYSDVDLHILVDYNQFQNNIKKLYVDFFDLKKIVFNQKRDIKFFGFDVELFVEDENDLTSVSGGIYSILSDEWLSKPNKNDFKTPNLNLVKQKSKQWMRIIDSTLKNIEDESPEEIKKYIKKYKEKLKKYRKSGLDKGGEMGLENLVFKVLRRNGYIEKLYDYPNKLMDKQLSLNEKIKN
jgi:predicted nucleotidyltransferase